MKRAIKRLAITMAAGLWMHAGPATAATGGLTEGGPGADSGLVRRAPTPPADGEGPALYRMRDLSGPRMGFTTVVGSDAVKRSMVGDGVGRTMSQFGWHLETQVVPLGGGPILVTEVIPLFGGFEYGKVIPSLTFALGIRSPGGYEIGMGPSLTPADSHGHSGAGLVIAAGRSVDYGGVSIPMNVAVSMNPRGTRASVLVGYAIRRASR